MNSPTKIAKEPLTTDHVFDRLFGECIEDVTDADHLRTIAVALYQLLDDIDTAGDIAKSDDKLYRNIVERIQVQKNKHLESDGYNLFLIK
jgi:hypothetical protein